MCSTDEDDDDDDDDVHSDDVNDDRPGNEFSNPETVLKLFVLSSASTPINLVPSPKHGFLPGNEPNRRPRIRSQQSRASSKTLIPLKKRPQQDGSYNCAHEAASLSRGGMGAAL